MEYRYREQKELIKGELGNIPKSWNQAKAQYYFDVFAGGTPSTNEPKYWDGDIPWINSGEVQNCYITNVSRYITNQGLKESSTKLIPKNTTVLAMTGATCGNVGYLQFDSTANQSVMAFVPKYSYNSKFLYYYLMCQSQQIEYYKTGGAQGGINVDNGKKLYINIPLDEEQEKIANFLDKKTSKFNSIISKKEALIEKLEEAKKSLISEVVTGKVKVVKTDDGYELVKRNSDEMKDSGVEWLGEIPKDWNCTKLKNICNNITDGAHISPETKNGVYPFISVKDLNENGLDFNNCLLTSIENYMYLKNNSCNPSVNDILISKDGTIGKTTTINYDKEFVVASSLVILTPSSDYKSEYVEYILNSNFVQKQIRKYVKGTALPRISIMHLKDIILPYTLDKNEQELMITYLKEKNVLIKALIQKTKQQIEKLKEAKQSLISEAVTGKIEILD